MLRKTFRYSLLLFALAGTVAGCSKKEQAPSFVDAQTDKTIAQVIESRPELSLLGQLLTKCGLMQELAASKAYTLWAPTEAALKTIDPAIAADSARLRAVLSNHLALYTHYTTTAGTDTRVALVNGKYAFFDGNSFEDAALTSRDLTARNGVLHMVAKVVAPLQNAWEFLNANAATYRQNAFILAQNYQAFVPALAIVDSISANTGLPVYRPNTGFVPRNRFNDQVFDMREEQRLYTYFVLQDAALRTETDKLVPYFRTSTPDSTQNLATFAVVRDLMVEGLYTRDRLPATLVSKFGVTIPVSASNIVSSHRLSNGIVHVLSGLNFPVAQKIGNVLVQGEQPRGTFRADGTPVNVRNSTFFRERLNPLTGRMMNDIYIYNHGVANLNVQYTAPSLPSARYRVYWVAANDTLRVNGQVNPVLYQQRLAVGGRTATTFPLRNVELNSYGEVLLGEYIHPSFGPLDLFLTAANSTAAGVNTLTLDYIRLEPQF